MKLKLDEMNSNLCPIVICVPGNLHAGALIVIGCSLTSGNNIHFAAHGESRKQCH